MLTEYDHAQAAGRSRARIRLQLAAAVPVLLGVPFVLAAGAGASTSRAASGGGTVGTVTSVHAAAKTFTVKTNSGSTIEVKVTKTTAFRDSLVSSPGFADVKVGVSVAVVGSSAKNGVETAVLVIVGGAGPSSGGAPGGPAGFGGPGGFRPGTFGKVTVVDAKAHAFTLKEASGKKVTVKVTSSTTYRDRAKAKAGFADVKVGEEVAVTGTTKNGDETATAVVVGAGRPFSQSAG